MRLELIRTVLAILPAIIPYRANKHYPIDACQRKPVLLLLYKLCIIVELSFALSFAHSNSHVCVRLETFAGFHDERVRAYQSHHVYLGLSTRQIVFCI